MRITVVIKPSVTCQGASAGRATSSMDDSSPQSEKTAITSQTTMTPGLIHAFCGPGSRSDGRSYEPGIGAKSRVKLLSGADRVGCRKVLGNRQRHLAGGSPFGAPHQGSDEPDAAHGIVGMSQHGVKHPPLTVVDRP